LPLESPVIRRLLRTDSSFLSESHSRTIIVTKLSYPPAHSPGARRRAKARRTGHKRNLVVRYQCKLSLGSATSALRSAARIRHKTRISRIAGLDRPSADPSCQTSAIKNSKRTGSLFADVSEPFFNSIDPKRTFGRISHAVEAGTGLAYAVSLGRIICLVGPWVRAIAATLTLCRNPARRW
jgi:hypothetical protein